jgi:hypothetical protein
MICSDKFPIGGSCYAYDRLQHGCSFLSLRESICLASILAAVERRRRAMFVEWSHSKWHKPRRGGTFPLPIERHAAPPELRPFSLYVLYKRDAPLALNLRLFPLPSAFLADLIFSSCALTAPPTDSEQKITKKRKVFSDEPTIFVSLVCFCSRYPRYPCHPRLNLRLRRSRVGHPRLLERYCGGGL